MDSARQNDEGASEAREIDAASLHARIQALTLETTAVTREVERLPRVADEHARPLELSLLGALRELSGVIERRTLVAPNNHVGPGAPDLPEQAAGAPAAPPAAEEPTITLDEAQRRHITRVLGMTRGRIYGEGGAAKLLGLKPSTLQSRMERLGMRKPSAARAAGAGAAPTVDADEHAASSNGSNGAGTHPEADSAPDAPS